MRALIRLLSFAGRLSRWPYAGWSIAAFLSQHLVVLLLLGAQTMPNDLSFYIAPLRSTLAAQSSDPLIYALAWTLLIAWVLAALAFRRAADAGVREWIAAAAVVPFLQLPVILLLSAMPTRAIAEPQGSAPSVSAARTRWLAAAQGLIAGAAVIVFSVAVSALVFHVYGYGLFVVSPFVVGAVAGYFANRNGDIGVGPTLRTVIGAALLGGIALVSTALEGVLCIAMAVPIGVLFVVAGGLLGRAIARLRGRPPRETASAVALLPLVFALEHEFPPLTTFDTEQTIAVNAPPAAVWRAIVRMDTIKEPRALPFHLGVAYPVRGEIVGSGLGALRYGEFSTGIAIERVTEWQENRKLAFVVETDIPSLAEISPYRQVHAPHAVGYFMTTLTSFELSARPGGGTEIIERTSHQLRLDPAPYWLPMARWIVRENNTRVLANIRRQAEASPP